MWPQLTACPPMRRGGAAVRFGAGTTVAAVTLLLLSACLTLTEVRRRPVDRDRLTRSCFSRLVPPSRSESCAYAPSFPLRQAGFTLEAVRDVVRRADGARAGARAGAPVPAPAYHSRQRRRRRCPQEEVGTSRARAVRRSCWSLLTPRPCLSLTTGCFSRAKPTCGSSSRPWMTQQRSTAPRSAFPRCQPPKWTHQTCCTRRAAPPGPLAASRSWRGRRARQTQRASWRRPRKLPAQR